MILRLADALGTINQVLLRLCRVATIVLCGVITVVVAAGVFWRYVLNDALSWTEEIAKFAMIWLTFVGAPVALVGGGHVSIEILQRLLPARLRHLLIVTMLGIVMAVLVIFVWRGVTFAWNGRTQVAAMAWDISMAWIFAAIPVGSLIMLSIALELQLRHLLHLIDPERHAAPVPVGEMAAVD